MKFNATYYHMDTPAGRLTISNGNAKLVPNNNVKYIIFSLPAIKTCPFATALCRANCYALKSERAYPSARASRSNNWDVSKTDVFTPSMIQLIHNTIARKSYATAKKIEVRIHESGDFYSADYFNKWLAIADAFRSDSRLVFVAYTKSLPFVHDVPANMVIRSSIWDDTSADMLELTDALGLPIYTAVPTFTNEPAREQCACVNCSTCFKCFSNKFELLKCEIH